MCAVLSEPRTIFVSNICICPLLPTDSFSVLHMNDGHTGFGNAANNSFRLCSDFQQLGNPSRESASARFGIRCRTPKAVLRLGRARS